MVEVGTGDRARPPGRHRQRRLRRQRRRRPRRARILQRTDLAIPDGMPVVWASRLLGTPVRERTTGVDLVPALVERAAADGHRIVSVRRRARRRRAGRRRRSRSGSRALDVVGARRPGRRRRRVDGRPGGPRARSAPLDPTSSCVALGNPKQERWIERYGTAVGAPVLIGIGGTLDFLTGATRRAPAWMQRVGLEWLHRALSEPRRLVGRYARDLRVFLPGVPPRPGAGGVGRGGRPGPRGRVPVRPRCSGSSGPVPVARLVFPVAASVGRRRRPRRSTSPGWTEFDNVSVSALVGIIRQRRRSRRRRRDPAAGGPRP